MAWFRRVNNNRIAETLRKSAIGNGWRAGWGLGTQNAILYAMNGTLTETKGCTMKIRIGQFAGQSKTPQELTDAELIRECRNDQANWRTACIAEYRRRAAKA
jgi:hypothetical protein